MNNMRSSRRNAKQDLEDSREIGRIMAEVVAGRPTLASAEVEEYLAVATPLAFSRKRAGKTQSALAAETGVSQTILADVESGQRKCSISVSVKLARALGIWGDDLVAA